MRITKPKRIRIVCEGQEEEGYINSLKNKAIFSEKYDIIPINAGSINNVFPTYQEAYQSDSYVMVLIFCDTDRGPSKKYLDVKKKINKFHGVDIADDIVIFGNPCTMQIILSHFTDIKVTSQSKSKNSGVIEELTGIKNYKASKLQREELFSKINRSNYKIMKKNVSKLSNNDLDISSTNILKFLEKLESDDISWIDEINNKLNN